MTGVMLAIFMVATDSHIVATAMPTIVADLGGFRLFSWAFAAFLLAQAVTIPIYGRLADLYGRKRVFFAGTSVFLLGSLLCGCAWDMGALVLFRAIQGIGAGAIQPIATTIIGDIYTPVERARMQGYVSDMYGVAAVIGPTLGAFVIEHVSWSLVFWVNLPIGAACFVMFGLFLHEHREPRRHRVDYLGSALLMLGVGAPMFALVQLGNADGPIVGALALGGAVALAALALNERRAAEPMLPLKLWRNRVVAVGCLAGFFNGALMMGVSGFLPTYVQGAMGRGATAAGVGARRVFGQLGLRQHGRGAPDDPHLIPPVGVDRRALAGCRQPRADPADPGERALLGRKRRLHARRRHGFLQYCVHRLDPGERRLERSRHGYLVDNVHAHRREFSRRCSVRRHPEFRRLSPAARCRRRREPADVAGGPAEPRRE
jgi:MFS family permease